MEKREREKNAGTVFKSEVQKNGAPLSMECFDIDPSKY